MLFRSFLMVIIVVAVVPSLTIADTKLTIYTTNYPLSYFADRIGGESVNVVFPVPQGVDPAFWTPGAATVRSMQKADLIVYERSRV